MANQAVFPVRTMCCVLGISASGFYAWRERAPSLRSITNAVMTERIRQIHKDSYESYGMPRVTHSMLMEHPKRFENQTSNRPPDGVNSKARAVHRIEDALPHALITPS